MLKRRQELLDPKNSLILKPPVAEPMYHLGDPLPGYVRDKIRAQVWRPVNLVVRVVVSRLLCLDHMLKPDWLLLPRRTP